MKKIILVILVTLLYHYSFCQTEKTAYNAALADSLGADAYGMKSYILVILKTGANTTESKERTDSLFAGHMKNMGRLFKEGKLIVAGPLKKNENKYRGIFILNTQTIDEANKLLETDPAISSGLLDAELFQWYGSAALPAYLPVHDMIQKEKF